VLSLVPYVLGGIPLEAHWPILRQWRTACNGPASLTEGDFMEIAAELLEQNLRG
jgi:hypothetical protein